MTTTDASSRHPAAPHLRAVGRGDDPVRSLARLLLAGEDFRAALSQQLGLGPSERLALSFLDDFGDRPQRELAERLRLTAGATTGVIDRLEQLGLAQRTSHPTDRRSSLVSLTPAGHSKIDEVNGYLARILELTAQVAPGTDAMDDLTAAIDQQVATMRRPVRTD